MYAELRSPNIHEPLNMAEYNNTILSYRDVTPVLWAGGTEIMSRPDYYPSQKANVELISLDKVEELHHFLRNDRFAEFGAMVSINDIAQAGKLVLSTLMILDAAVEIRYLKKRMHSKWFQLSRIYDKNGKLEMQEGGLLSKVRIAIQQYDYQYFRSAGSPMSDKENAVSLALVARFEQGNISYARIIFTLPDKGFCYSRDLDNLITSVQLPLGITRYSQVENYVVDYIKENLSGISALQEARIKGLFHDMFMDMNETVLCYTPK